jgi:hypothetical protein
MHTGKDNDKDLRPVMRCDAELNCTAAPQLVKAVAEELKDKDKDLAELLEKELPSATE